MHDSDPALAPWIADAANENFHKRWKTATKVPADMVAEYVASTFILVLQWWPENKSPLPPRGVNDLFRAMVIPPLATIAE